MSKPATTIAAHSRVKGELHLDGPGLIAGHIQGNVTAADALEIASEGIIDGNIQAVAVTIHGTVKGNVMAPQACRLGASARVAGDICTGDLAIAKGARFIGQVCVGDDMAGPPAVSSEAAEEAAAIRVVEATIQRVERTAARMEETPPVATTMSIPGMPAVQVLTQNVQTVLRRAPRIIKAV